MEWSGGEVEWSGGEVEWSRGEVEWSGGEVEWSAAGCMEGLEHLFITICICMCWPCTINVCLHQWWYLSTVSCPV